MIKGYISEWEFLDFKIEIGLQFNEIKIIFVSYGIIEEDETFNFFFNMNNWFVINFWEYRMKIYMSRINEGILVMCSKLFLTIIEINLNEGYFWTKLGLVYSLLELKKNLMNYDIDWTR